MSLEQQGYRQRPVQFLWALKPGQISSSTSSPLVINDRQMMHVRLQFPGYLHGISAEFMLMIMSLKYGPWYAEPV